MKNDNYIMLKDTGHGYQIYIVTKKQKTLLTKDNAKKMLKILNNYKEKRVNNHTYIYKDYDKIMQHFFSSKKENKINRKKSKMIAIGVISGTLATILISGTFDLIKAKKENKEIADIDNTSAITSEFNKNNVQLEDLNSDIGITIDIPLDEEFDDTNINNDLNLEITEKENQTNTYEFSYKYAGNYDFNTVINAKKYNEFFEKYGNMYGIDPKLLLLIGAQENAGIHTIDENKAAIGIMGVEKWWIGKNLTIYNFESNDYETIIIDKEKLEDLGYNIKVGAAIFSYCLDYTNKKFEKGTITIEEFLPFAIQTYNMGTSNMDLILKNNGYWFDNRELIKEGDSKYIEHVFCEANNDQVYTIKLSNGNIINIKMINLNDWIFSNVPNEYCL